MSIIDITVPAESLEGTTMKVQTWLKQVGDSVKKDEPIVEMETDKVTLEIESPSDGVLHEILAEPDTEVSPEMVIAKVETVQSDTTKNHSATATIDHLNSSPKSDSRPSTGNIISSPAVKQFVIEHDLDITQIVGTGKNGRVTLKDAKAFVQNDSNTADALPEGDIQEGDSQEGNSRLVPHSAMRRSIADHMSSSVKEAPHVTAIFEADFSAIMAHRAAHKEDFLDRGVKLTFTAYFLFACAQAMKLVPEVNSQWHDDSLELFSQVNIGVGTALGDQGLVVPVINAVQEKNLFDLAEDLQDISTRARENKLKPNDMRGGTFTISNHGVSGSLLATPIIINQPQSAILGVGKLEKRVVVHTIEGQDVMLIKPMAYVSLSIDHRVIDGHQTNTWLSEFVTTLENWPIT